MRKAPARRPASAVPAARARLCPAAWQRRAVRLRIFLAAIRRRAAAGSDSSRSRQRSICWKWRISRSWRCLRSASFASTGSGSMLRINLPMYCRWRTCAPCEGRRRRSRSATNRLSGRSRALISWSGSADELDARVPARRPPPACARSCSGAAPRSPRIRRFRLSLVILPMLPLEAGRITGWNPRRQCWR